MLGRQESKAVQVLVEPEELLATGDLPVTKDLRGSWDQLVPMGVQVL